MRIVIIKARQGSICRVIIINLFHKKPLLSLFPNFKLHLFRSKKIKNTRKCRADGAPSPPPICSIFKKWFL